MQGKMTIVSGEASKGLVATLEDVKIQNQRLLDDNIQFKADNEEFRKELARPKSVTGKVLAWFKKEA